MRWLGSLLLLASLAQAMPDAAKAYRGDMKKARVQEEKFWKEFLQRSVDARFLFLEPYRDMVRAMNNGKLGTNRDLSVDLTAFGKLYEDYAVIQRERLAAAGRLSLAGGDKAVRRLLDELLDTVGEIEAAEVELWKNKRSGGWGWFDQRPGVRRHGLAVRRDGLVALLGATPGAGAHMATGGFARATKLDRGRSLRHRVAVLDALGAGRDPAGIPVLVEALRAEEPALRIAAVENLARKGAVATADLVPLLKEDHPTVRRALLGAIRRETKRDPRFIGPVLAHYADARGVERQECIDTLTKLTWQKFGDDLEAWRMWFVDHEEAIEDGTFDVKKVEIVPVKTREVPDRTVFFGVATASRGVLFVVEGGHNLQVPADAAVARKRAYWDWVLGNPDWRKGISLHKDALLANFDRALKDLPEDASFGVLMCNDGFSVKTLGEKRLLKVTSRDLKAAKRFLEIHAPRGYRSALANLVTAMEMASVDPRSDLALPPPQADTVFLHADGLTLGGRFLYVPAVLDAFERANRFRRLVVHAIRICNGGPDAEELMRGLAERSGGTYKRR